jgi:hypothetical protein
LEHLSGSSRLCARQVPAASADTLGVPGLSWKGFCFCFCCLRGGAERSEARPPARAIRIPAKRAGACGLLHSLRFAPTGETIGFNYRILLQSARGFSLQSARGFSYKMTVENFQDPQVFQHFPPKWPWLAIFAQPLETV